jgi:hypothetical protein
MSGSKGEVRHLACRHVVKPEEGILVRSLPRHFMQPDHWFSEEYGLVQYIHATGHWGLSES